MKFDRRIRKILLENVPGSREVEVVQLEVESEDKKKGCLRWAI
jgi:hypothetical protein